ncbi:VIPAS39 (predicted) [Pycnogonum litorale]
MNSSSARFKQGKDEAVSFIFDDQADTFWNESAASKSTFVFDDDDDSKNWELHEHYFDHKPVSGKSGTPNTSTTSSFESIRSFNNTMTESSFDRKDLSIKKPVVHCTKKNLQASQGNRFDILPISSTISSIVRGDLYMLELYKSKELKLSLLDAAIKSGDGNAIVAAVLYLRRTLKQSMFNAEIKTRPVAISHHVNYLRNHCDFNDLSDFLVMLGKSEEAAMVKLKLAMSHKSPEQRINALDHCKKLYFLNDAQLKFHCNIIDEEITLLQKQLAITKSDEQLHQITQHGRTTGAATSSSGKQNVTTPPSLVGMPVVTTLYYCTLYHYNDSENSFSNPVSLKKSHQLTDKQYTWTVIAALAKKTDWSHIESFLTSKTLFGGAKLKSCIGFDKVADILHKAGANPDVIIKYLKLVDSEEVKLSLAKKFRCHTLVVDTLVILKDLQGLVNYRTQLKPGTYEYSYIENALRASTVKWKS